MRVAAELAVVAQFPVVGWLTTNGFQHHDARLVVAGAVLGVTTSILYTRRETERLRED